MLHHGRQGDRHDGDHGGDQQRNVHISKQGKHGIFVMNGQADPRRLPNRRKIHVSGDCRNQIGAHDAQDDRHNLDHSLSPDIADNHNYYGDHRNPPACRTVIDCGF